jgi:hypothetical protein
MQGQLEFSEEIVTLRDLVHEDLTPYCDYFYRSPAGFLEGMGVDIANLPPEENLRHLLQLSIEHPLPFDRRPADTLIITFAGKAIGNHSLTNIEYGSSGIFHAHIWSPDFRRKSLGSYTYPRACLAFMERFDLKKMFFETPVVNAGPNRLKQKLGLKPLGEGIARSPMCGANTRIFLYEWDRDQIEYAMHALRQFNTLSRFHCEISLT